MIVQTVRRQTEAERHANYRARTGEAYRTKNKQRMRTVRKAAIPEFVAVDSEGIGKGPNHRAVLIGVGEQQYVARDIHSGLQWKETFQFLYECFEQKPDAVYVGFYLSYDFNTWLHTLPERSAWYLLSERGKALRKMSDNMGKRRTYYPVRVDGWEIDTLGFKRLAIRPQVCHCAEEKIRGCKHEQKPWMYICDAGPFYQMTFLQVCDPKLWAQDPDGPICTDAEYADLKRGKERRDHADLDEEMKHYNRLENELLARCMVRLFKGFNRIGIRLAKDQWYGPGASAAKWLQSHGAVKHRDLVKIMPQWFEDACLNSYVGGWFEIFSHGIILGESYNYDINNAYPYATTKLPHLCSECQYKRGHGVYKGSGDFVLLLATVRTKSTRIGAVPYRDSKGSILRPSVSRGWYWQREIQAATRAGLVNSSKTEYHEWVEFIPCSHPNPFTEVEDLYNERLRVGKNSAHGMAIKLNNNSAYGKFAQNTGGKPFNNWLYASYITSHCRIQILDAIATHPGGADSTLMVATDGVLFDSPHPSLPISKNLGEWEETTYTDVCLFKPGVYWHREGKDALTQLVIKSRGVPKAEFADAIDTVEYHFRLMLDNKTIPGDPVISSIAYHENGDMWFKLEGLKEWPWFQVFVNFRMKSCKQALNEGKWGRAATVQERFPILQSSNPESKRCRPTYNRKKNRIDTHIHDLPQEKVQSKYFPLAEPDDPDIGFDFDGNAVGSFERVLSVARDKDTPAIYPRKWGYTNLNVEWDEVK